MYSYLDKLQVGKKALRHLWGGGARVLPIHGEVAPKAPEGLVVLCNVSSHSWGGGAEGAGGGTLCFATCPPIHGEVAPKAPERLVVLCNVSSPFMGRWRRRRRRGSLCFATCPPHSWGGGAEGAGGARVPYPEPCIAAPIAPAQIPSAPPTTEIRRTSVT